MEIKRSKKANKRLAKMQVKLAKRIVDAISKLPDNGDVDTITGAINEYRLRVGDYRVLFIINDNAIYITDIKSRGEAYKKGMKP